MSDSTIRIVEDLRQEHLRVLRRAQEARTSAEAVVRIRDEQLRQAQRMAAIGQFAGGVAHDFNNLLTVIIGYTELVLEGAPEGDPQHARVEQILKASEQAVKLTRQLLAYSRKPAFQPEILDLNAVVGATMTMLRCLVGAKVELVSVLGEPPGHVKLDPGQVEQILLNLAANARDAMPKGGRLTIETAKAELDAADAEQHGGVQPGSYLTLAVGDTGQGMSGETLERLFEPFFTTKEPGKGTGLGLATVHSIVEQSGGHVLVSSEPGHGTTFKVYLPRVAEETDSVTMDRRGGLQTNGSGSIR